MNLDKPGMIQPALVGGVFLGITSAFPVIQWFNCACCILVLAGGMLASYLYLRDYPAGTAAATYGDGALLGMLTGLIGGIVWTAVEIPLAYFKVRFGMSLQDFSQLEDLLDNAHIPPILEQLASGGALTLGIIVLSLLLQVVIATIFACIGGVIGIALFGSGRPADRQPPAAPPAPPPTGPSWERDA